MEGAFPLILIEGVLVFGGVLAFAWWQFRDLRREREKSARAAAEALHATQPEKADSQAGGGGLS